MARSPGSLRGMLPLRSRNADRRKLILAVLAFFLCVHLRAALAERSPPGAFSLPDLERRTFGYFWDLADPRTGLTPDRHPTRTFTSIAATGFGLAAYVVGVEKKHVTREEAAGRVLTLLRFLSASPTGEEPAGVSRHRGFFYHFLEYDTGTRFRNVELSTIDTALLMAGVLCVQSYFDRDTPVEEEIRRLADGLYRAVEWDWVLRDSGRLGMGWKPESGFLKAEWQGYNEAMILYVLALGSPTHPIPAAAWDAWTSTYQWGTFQGQEHLNFAPLFGHQYSHLFIDFRGVQDAYMRGKGIDYFENSRRATLSQRAYAMENPGSHRGYSGLVWGLTACDGPANARHQLDGRTVVFHEYWARGAALTEIRDDGTIAPTAAGGSLPFAPEICLPALRHMWESYGTHLVGRYGFKDAFNLTYPEVEGGWFDRDYLGIDQGPILLQIANHESDLIWELMKKSPPIVRGLKQAGFRGGWLDP